MAPRKEQGEGAEEASSIGSIVSRMRQSISTSGGVGAGPANMQGARETGGEEAAAAAAAAGSALARPAVRWAVMVVVAVGLLWLVGAGSAAPGKRGMPGLGLGGRSVPDLGLPELPGADAPQLRAWSSSPVSQPAKVIVLSSGKRVAPLRRLLASLESAQYGGDAVELRIVVDAGAGEEWEAVVALSRAFAWPHGAKELRVEGGGAARGQLHLWTSCWEPISDGERAVIFKEDLVASPLFYRYLRRAWHVYGGRPELAALTLERMSLIAATPARRSSLRLGPDPFGYQLPGQNGLAPNAMHWRKFIRLDFASIEPDVELLETTRWFRAPGGRQWWLQYFIWFCDQHSLYTVHITPRNGEAFAADYHELEGALPPAAAAAALTNAARGKPDFPLVQRWAVDFQALRPSISLYDWSAKFAGSSSIPLADSDEPFLAFPEPAQDLVDEDAPDDDSPDGADYEPELEPGHARSVADSPGP
jgi:hypothetical protein